MIIMESLACRRKVPHICLLWSEDASLYTWGAGERCIVCSKNALPARVIHVDDATRCAIVAVRDQTNEVDISLVRKVIPGDLLLVHGNVAIRCLDEVEEC